jgi:hypothetical protein
MYKLQYLFCVESNTAGVISNNVMQLRRGKELQIADDGE